MNDRASVLLIYTGGTIGMWADPRTGVLRPMDLAHLEEQVPELQRIKVNLESVAFDRPMDSSDLGPLDWVRIAREIGKHYDRFDGFVILHGSDTMAYTASALSFLLEGLSKPVILTGSQLPIGTIRTDAKENLITAIEIAGAKDDLGRPMVPEVAVYFEYRLLRGNRTVKVHAERFEAFRSPNWPVLAEAGVHIRYDRSAILPFDPRALKVHDHMDQRVAVIRLFPGISPAWLDHAMILPDLKAVILTTFGSGNGPTEPAFIQALRSARERDIALLNVTQCVGGRVEQGRYTTSRAFTELGVIPCADMTVEAALAKTMFLLAGNRGTEGLAQAMATPIRGEFTLI
ncbi:MAG TPA: type I asparaginase [Flavobacteriales bacterium]|jgi:L-asparaginase|nr:type I asparaginase [Flavobacteriales bacterium]MBP9178084.1 type I asparaginase [Flavobacteriales bacterium]MCC6910717.1 type I asparaginase [Flavobacteriales bacterium]HQW06554.1 type I asparaginase [Flavobacteriales bacterium]HQX98148.1 type I asparaginase [Flavobacteriales bacterium]